MLGNQRIKLYFDYKSLLGASPDSIVSCKCCGEGCLEVKSPFSYKDKFITESMTDKNTCLIKLRMKKSNWIEIVVTTIKHNSNYLQLKKITVTFTLRANPARWDIFSKNNFKTRDFLHELYLARISWKVLYKNSRKWNVSTVANDHTLFEAVFCYCKQPDFCTMTECDNIQILLGGSI